jgi:hypothetical protein
MPRRCPCHPLPPPMSRNTHQDSSSINNALNSCNSLTTRRITATTAMAVVAAMVAVAPQAPLPPRVRGLPASTPGPTLFKCGQVPGGRRPVTSPTSAGCASWRPSLWSSTAGRATLHATTRASAHPPRLAASSSTSGSGDMVPMDGLMGSIVAGQLLQHHEHGPSCGHRLGARLWRLQPHHL